MHRTSIKHERDHGGYDMTEAAELKPEELVRNSCDCILFHSWIRTGEKRKVDDNFICGDILVGIGYY